MTRLPIVDSDNGTWGTILNQFLDVSHNADGSLIPSAVANAGAVTSVNGKTGNSVTLAASDVGADASGAASSAQANAESYALTQAQERILWRGAWAADTAYAVNDAVIDNGGVYVCTTAHTSGSSFNGANWTELNAPNGTYVSPLGSNSSQIIPSKLPFFNVKDYGAKGDGSTDDTTAIQAAITAAQVNGGEVFFPVGTYVTSSTLSITSNAVSLVGATSLGINNGVIIAPNSLSFDVIEVNAVNYATVIKSLQIKAYTTSGTGGRGIFLNNVQNVLIRDVVISGLWDGVFVTGGGVLMENVGVGPADVAGTGRYGFWCSGLSGNANATTMVDCTVSQIGQTNGNTVDGFVLADGYNSLELRNCAALSCNRGLWSTLTTGTAPNFLVADIFTSDHSNIGVLLAHGNFATFDQLLVISSLTATTGSVVVSSTYESGPVQFSNVALFATSGGIQILGGTIVAITNAELLKIGAGTGGLLSALEVSGGPTVVVAGLAAGMATGATVGTVQLDTGFTGTFIMSGFNLAGNDYGFAVAAGATGIFRLSNGTITNSFSGAVSLGATPGGSRISGVNGANPFGPQTAPTVPASTVFLLNPFPFDCMVCITGGTVTEININGIATGLIPPTSIRLPVGQKVKMTYSAAPTWTWFGD